MESQLLVQLAGEESTGQNAMLEVAGKAPEAAKEAPGIIHATRAHCRNAKLPTTDVYPRPVRGER
jgi:hypothetical protein